MKPVLQALVLADRVYQDVSGKKIICGTFDAVVIVPKELTVKEKELPGGRRQQIVAGGMHGGSPYAYLSLTDIHVRCELELQFVDLTKNVVLFAAKVAVESNDRLQSVEVVLPLPPLPINKPGVFAFVVVCEGEILGSHRIVARRMLPGTPPTEE